VREAHLNKAKDGEPEMGDISEQKLRHAGDAEREGMSRTDYTG